jgi:predicted nucleotidyltransferase component of viral defense system
MLRFDKQYLAQLASETGFLRDNLEKVIRLTDILYFINNDAYLSQRLALKGGTAINLTVFKMPRLSVDIDLDYCNDCNREDMLSDRQHISDLLISYMTTTGYAHAPSTKSPHSLDSWVFNYVNAGTNLDNIKIEINYSMRCHIYPVHVCYPSIPFLGNVKLNALAPVELFGSKIKALIERSACRDLYDVANMVHQNVFMSEELSLLRKTVLFYLTVGGSQPPQHVYSLQSINNITFRQIRATLIPVLRKGERFDFSKAKIVVNDFLTNLLQFTDSEHIFIDNFNAGQYQPELLFQDKDILSRICNHPMAIWKTMHMVHS